MVKDFLLTGELFGGDDCVLQLYWIFIIIIIFCMFLDGSIQ